MTFVNLFEAIYKLCFNDFRTRKDRKEMTYLWFKMGVWFICFLLASFEISNYTVEQKTEKSLSHSCKKYYLGRIVPFDTILKLGMLGGCGDTIFDAKGKRMFRIEHTDSGANFRLIESVN